MLYFIAVLIIAVAAAISSSRKEPLDCEKAREQGFWHAKAIWNNLISPALASHVDSLLTSEDS